MPESLPRVEIITERPKLIAGRDQTIDVLLRITPPEFDTSKPPRPKLNLSLVLDRSGSMGGVKMQRAREATVYCVDELLPTDQLSVVVFDEHIDTLVPSQLVTNKAMMKDLISRVNSRGSTALHEAWVRGGMEVSEHLFDEGVNRVILITDGQANVGVTSADEIVSQALGLFKRGVSTSTIGIGDDFNEDLLLPMAQSAGGNAWHVAEAGDMQRIFQVELQGLVAQFGHSVTLGLMPADGVRIVDLLNDFELTENGRYRLPNLTAGSPLEIVLQLKAPAQQRGSQLRLLDLTLGFTRQEAKTADVLPQAFTLEFADESDVNSLPVDPEVARAVRFLMNARARVEAMRRIDLEDYVGAEAMLASSVAATRVACAPMASRSDVMAECASMEEVQSSLKDRLLDKMSRKKLAYASYNRRSGKD